jgi:hypothetical protein
MKRSQINPMPQYYDHYINLVADVELSEAFDQSIKQLNELDRDLLTRLADQMYAPEEYVQDDRRMEDCLADRRRICHAENSRSQD